MTHICVGKPAIIGSDNGLSPDRRQAIIWTNAGILLIGPSGTYFSEILTGIQTFSFKKMHLKMSSTKWCSFWLGLNVLIGALRTDFSEIVSEIHTFSFKKMHLKTSSTKLWQFCLDQNVLTLWGRVTHICVSKLTSIGSDNGLSPGRRQAIIWTNTGMLLIGPLRKKFNGILIEIPTFSFKEMHLKMPSGKWQPFCLGLNVLKWINNTRCDFMSRSWGHPLSVRSWWPPQCYAQLQYS